MLRFEKEFVVTEARACCSKPMISYSGAPSMFKSITWAAFASGPTKTLTYIFFSCDFTNGSVHSHWTEVQPKFFLYTVDMNFHPRNTVYFWIAAEPIVDKLCWHNLVNCIFKLLEFSRSKLKFWWKNIFIKSELL